MNRNANKKHPEVIRKDEGVHSDDHIKDQRRPMCSPKLRRARCAQKQGISRYSQRLEQRDDFWGYGSGTENKDRSD